MRRMLMAIASPENETVGECCVSLMVLRRYQEDEGPEYIVHGLTWDDALEIVEMKEFKLEMVAKQTN